MTRLMLVMFSVLMFAGCNGTSAGIPCETRDECEAGQDCFEAPGGFCTRGCSEAGTTRECPVGTVCTTFTGAGAQVCSNTCERNADCRVNFECQLTHQGSSVSACRPVR